MRAPRQSVLTGNTCSAGGSLTTAPGRDSLGVVAPKSFNVGNCRLCKSVEMLVSIFREKTGTMLIRKNLLQSIIQSDGNDGTACPPTPV